MNTQEYTYEEFVSFLLIYAAHADVEYTEREQAFIKAKVSEASYEKVYSDFNSMTDIKVLQLIESYKDQYYSTPEQKTKLMGHVQALFDADGNYSSMEKTLKLFLDHLL
jgi:hypothetical protein